MLRSWISPPSRLRQFAADRQAQTGAAVFAAGAGIGLLERLEDDALLFRRDADAGVGDLERDTVGALPQRRMVACGQPARPRAMRSRTLPCSVNLNAFDSRFFRTCCRRFESVVMLRQAADRAGPRTTGCRFSASWRNGRVTVSCRLHKKNFLGIDRHRAGLDLRQIENVADQVQQVGAGAVDGAREFDLPRREVAVRSCRQAAGRGSGSSSAACAVRATCWPGTRTCISRSARARSPSPPARGAPVRSPGSCARPRRCVRRAAAPSARAARWSAATRAAGVCNSIASCCDCFSRPSVCIVASMLFSTMPMPAGQLLEERHSADR